MKIRMMLSILAVVLAAYFVARAAIVSEPMPQMFVRSAGAVLFAAITSLALAVPNASAGLSRAGSAAVGRMPLWAAAVAAAGAAALPLLATSGMVRDGHAAGPHLTWFIGAGGLVLTIVCARRRQIIAWAGVIVFALGTMFALGSVVEAFVAGLLGSLVWVGAAQLIVLFTDQAHRDTARLALIQQKSAAWRATQEVLRRERRTRVQAAIRVAGPVLARVIETGGRLSGDERGEAIFAEATLRDELRGRTLLDPSVRDELATLRRAGSTVTLFDEGGLDGMSADALSRVRRELAGVLNGMTAANIIVRTSRLADTAVTVVGRSLSDDVELWSEIPREDPGRRSRPGS